MQSNDEGLEKIKQKIMADAKTNVKKIMDETKKEADKINEANKSNAEAYKKKAQEKLKSDVKLFINKTMAQARLKSRRVYLEKREKLMESLIEDVLTKFERKSKDYEEYIEKILANNLSYLMGDVSIFCNKKDHSLVKSLVDNIKRGDESKISNIKIKEADIIGGLILEDSEGKRINESIDSKFERVKQKIRKEIIKLLGWN